MSLEQNVLGDVASFGHAMALGAFGLHASVRTDWNRTQWP
jgi:hypothetical protein